MTHFKLFLGTALAVSLTGTAYAQMSTVVHSAQADNTNIVRAQFIRPGDVSTEEYEALLAEADRVRAFQSASGAYTGVSYAAATNTNVAATESQGYQIDIYEEPSVSSNVVTTTTVPQYPMAKTYPLGTDFSSAEFTAKSATTTYAAPITYGATTIYAAPVAEVTSASLSSPVMTYDNAVTSTFQNTAPTSHYVVKGDTLYNIAKRNNTSVSALKAANGLFDNTISLGQSLTIPGGQRIVNVEPQAYSRAVTSAAQTIVTQPYSTTSRPTLVRNVEPLPSGDNYAVLPKDTLYSISRRACVSVSEISAINGHLNPQTLQPGQRIVLPGGHCMR